MRDLLNLGSLTQAENSICRDSLENETSPFRLESYLPITQEIEPITIIEKSSLSYMDKENFPNFDPLIHSA